MSLRRFFIFAFSILLHVCFFLSLSEKKFELPKSEPAVIDLVESSAKALESHPSQSAPRSRIESKIKKKQIDYSLRLKPSGETERIEIGGNNLTAGDLGTRAIFGEAVRLTPCLIDLHQKIDSQFIVSSELVFKKDYLSGRAKILVQAKGAGLKILTVDSSDQFFKAVISTALLAVKDIRLPHCVHHSAFEASLEFQAEVTDKQPSPPMPVPKVAAFQLNFHRFFYRPPLFSARNTLDERGQTIGVDLVQLYLLIFKRREEDPLILQHDLSLRLNEASRVCETQLADGACFEAAKIFEAFGNERKAKEYLKKACSFGLQEACAGPSKP